MIPTVFVRKDKPWPVMTPLHLRFILPRFRKFYPSNLSFSLLFTLFEIICDPLNFVIKHKILHTYPYYSFIKKSSVDNKVSRFDL